MSPRIGTPNMSTQQSPRRAKSQLLHGVAKPRVSTPSTAGRYNRLALDFSMIRFADPLCAAGRRGY